MAYWLNQRWPYGKAYLSIETYILYGIILEYQKTFDVGLIKHIRIDRYSPPLQLFICELFFKNPDDLCNIRIIPPLHSKNFFSANVNMSIAAKKQITIFRCGHINIYAYICMQSHNHIIYILKETNRKTLNIKGVSK